MERFNAAAGPAGPSTPGARGACGRVMLSDHAPRDAAWSGTTAAARQSAQTTRGTSGREKETTCTGTGRRRRHPPHQGPGGRVLSAGQARPPSGTVGHIAEGSPSSAPRTSRPRPGGLPCSPGPAGARSPAGRRLRSHRAARPATTPHMCREVCTCSRHDWPRLPLLAVVACPSPSALLPRSPAGWSKAFRAKLKQTALGQRVLRGEAAAASDPAPQRGEEEANAQQQVSPRQPADNQHSPGAHDPKESAGENAQSPRASDEEDATDSSVRKHTPKHAHREVQTNELQAQTDAEGAVDGVKGQSHAEGHARRNVETRELEVQTDASPFRIVHLRAEAPLWMNTKGTNTEKEW